MAKLNSIPPTVEADAVETKLEPVVVADAAENLPDAAVEGAAEGVAASIADNVASNETPNVPMFTEAQIAAIDVMINHKIAEHFASIKPVEAPPKPVDDGAALRAKQEKARIKEEARKAQEHQEKIEAATAAYLTAIEPNDEPWDAATISHMVFSDGNRFLFEIPPVDLAGKIDLGQGVLINSKIIIPDYLPAVVIAEAWLVADNVARSCIKFGLPCRAGGGQSAEFGANTLAF